MLSLCILSFLIRVVNDYGIGTLSWYVQRSSIEKWGTLECKAFLPAPIARNKAHRAKRTFVIYGDTRVDGRVRVNKVPWKTVVRQAVGEQVSAAFKDAFGGAIKFLFACFFFFHSWAWD